MVMNPVDEKEYVTYFRAIWNEADYLRYKKSWEDYERLRNEKYRPGFRVLRADIIMAFRNVLEELSAIWGAVERSTANKIYKRVLEALLRDYKERFENKAAKVLQQEEEDDHVLKQECELLNTDIKILKTRLEQLVLTENTSVSIGVMNADVEEKSRAINTAAKGWCTTIKENPFYFGLACGGVCLVIGAGGALCVGASALKYAFIGAGGGYVIGFGGHLTLDYALNGKKLSKQFYDEHPYQAISAFALAGAIITAGIAVVCGGIAFEEAIKPLLNEAVKGLPENSPEYAAKLIEARNSFAAFIKSLSVVKNEVGIIAAVTALGAALKLHGKKLSCLTAENELLKKREKSLCTKQMKQGSQLKALKEKPQGCLVRANA